MHETLRHMLHLMGFSIKECRERHKCFGVQNRVFDSHDGYSTRYATSYRTCVIIMISGNLLEYVTIRNSHTSREKSANIYGP